MRLWNGPTIQAKSLWPPSEESPPPLPLFQCCSNDVDFSFDFFPTCKTTLGRGYGGKRKPLSNVVVWDCCFRTYHHTGGFVFNDSFQFFSIFFLAVVLHFLLPNELVLFPKFQFERLTLFCDPFFFLLQGWVCKSFTSIHFKKIPQHQGVYILVLFNLLSNFRLHCIYSWTSITRTLGNSNSPLTRSKTNFPWICLIYLL